METQSPPRLDMDRVPTLAQIRSRPVMVSEHSLFTDDVWYLDGHVPGYTERNFAIHWEVVADQDLIDDAKYLAALLFLERGGRRIYKHTTASTFSAGIRHLLRFMHRHGYSSFGEIDATAVKLFRDHLHVALSDPERAEEEQDEQEELEEDAGSGDEGTVGPAAGPEGAEPPRSTRGPKQRRKPRAPKPITEDELTYSAAYNRLRPLQNLWDLHEEMRAAGIRAMREEPFPGSSPKEQAEHDAAVAVKLIPPLPDEVAIAIMTDAFNMIGKPADDVIELQSRYLAQMARLDREPPTHERARLKAVVEGFRFAEVDGAPWHAPVRLGPHEASGSEVMHDLVHLIRDACTTVIFSGTGCRISEVLSLELTNETQDLPLFATRQPEDALPSCVTTRKSKSGLHQQFFMKAKLSKNEDEPKDETWLIGSRPMDRADIEPPVLRAIRVLERLFAPWRDFATAPAAKKGLILAFSARGLPRKGRGVLPAAVGHVRSSLADYVARPEIGLSSMKAAARDNPKLAPYVKHNGRCIRPHQWRKTFALYMMRLDERMIPALANHFKHMSIAVTEGAYMPQEPSMIAARDSVHMMETHRALYEMRRGAGSTFGKLDRAMDGFKDDLRRLIGDLPLEENFEEIESALLTRDLRIYQAEHGRCLIAANPDRARCHDAGGTSSWRRLQPNHETRTPGLCAGCDNFSISREHAGFWAERYVENQRNWLLSDRSADFEIIHRRATQAAGVLRALGIAPPVVTAEHVGTSGRAVAPQGGFGQPQPRA